MTHPVEYRTQNENAHTGEVRVVIPDQAVEPLWSDAKVRAVALELAIKTVADKEGFSTANVLDIAAQYLAFVGGEEF